MADEEKQEFGASLMFIGLALAVAALLVVFFLPAGVRLGHQTVFFIIIGVLGVAALFCVISGYRKRRGAGEER
jgi:phosphatidylserine synthase